MTRTTILTDEQAWIIIEHLMNSHNEWEFNSDDFDPELVESRKGDIEHLLDVLSPNWKTADSCKDVQSNTISVSTRKSDTKRMEVEP